MNMSYYKMGKISIDFIMQVDDAMTSIYTSRCINYFSFFSLSVIINNIVNYFSFFSLSVIINNIVSIHLI